MGQTAELWKGSMEMGKQKMKAWLKTNQTQLQLHPFAALTVLLQPIPLYWKYPSSEAASSEQSATAKDRKYGQTKQRAHFTLFESLKTPQNPKTLACLRVCTYISQYHSTVKGHFPSPHATPHQYLTVPSGEALCSNQSWTFLHISYPSHSGDGNQLLI